MLPALPHNGWIKKPVLGVLTILGLKSQQKSDENKKRKWSYLVENEEKGPIFNLIDKKN